MPEPPLLYEKDPANHRCLITLNRPERMNAMSLELLRLLDEAAQDLNDDPDMWVAIVTGAGDRAFCAGADLGSTIPSATAANRTEQLRVNETRWLHGVNKPIIAAVNGYCIAGGVELLLGTDIRVAASQAQFALQEVRWGLVPLAGAHIRLPRQIPWCWAMEILLTGRRLSAAEALQCGLINRVVPAEQLMQAANGIADLICRNGPLAVRTAKEIAVRGRDGDVLGAGLEPGVAARRARLRQRGCHRRSQGVHGET